MGRWGACASILLDWEPGFYVIQGGCASSQLIDELLASARRKLECQRLQQDSLGLNMMCMPKVLSNIIQECNWGSVTAGGVTVTAEGEDNHLGANTSVETGAGQISHHRLPNHQCKCCWSVSFAIVCKGCDNTVVHDKMVHSGAGSQPRCEFS